jgi:hypothetical protein
LWFVGENDFGWSLNSTIERTWVAGVASIQFPLVSTLACSQSM